MSGLRQPVRLLFTPALPASHACFTHPLHAPRPPHPPHPSECLGKGTYWTPATGLARSNRLVDVPGLSLSRSRPAPAPQPIIPSASAPEKGDRMSYVMSRILPPLAVSPASELHEDGKGGDPTPAAAEAYPGAGGITSGPGRRGVASGGARPRERRGALTNSRLPIVMRSVLTHACTLALSSHSGTRVPATYHHLLPPPTHGPRHSRREQCAAALRPPHQAQDLGQARRGACTALPRPLRRGWLQAVRSYEVSRTSSVASRKYCVSITATPLYLLLPAHYYRY